jgi:hypothetical protein
MRPNGSYIKKRKKKSTFFLLKKKKKEKKEKGEIQFFITSALHCPIERKL